ncbi:MAG TPA: tRNA epoxyqueuosine(34) reductase QueG [Anaerolineae bacterium]|nr:tRNA epoxyqueuosine(34) reductase QueG [Anaerolineae bacterium]
MSDELVWRLKERARELGFSMIGVVEARPGRRMAAYMSWLANGYQGQMGYLSRPDRLARRRDPKVILPGVKSIICVGLDYSTGAAPAGLLADPGRGRIASYAWGVDYHGVMLPRLQQLADWLEHTAGGDVASKVYVDTGAILERDHAESAGLGFTGKNTMLIAPRAGSWLFLGELLTTAVLPPDEVQPSMPGCGSCTRCLEVCPTAAFPEPYVLDARRCISYLTIELKDWIPRLLRPLMGNWVFGCDICQEICPFNRFAPGKAETIFRPSDWEAAAPSIIELLALDEEGFARRFAASPIKRIRRHRLVRNACVAAGNWGSPAAVGPLISLLGDDYALVRGHAAWALGKIQVGDAQKALVQARAKESNETVSAELSLALAVVGGS